MHNKAALSKLVISMCIFGTVGILRRFIPMPSSIVALFRAIIGTVFLLTVMAISKRKFNRKEVRNNLLLLILSSCLMGFNWIFLFEAYCYTTVTTATLCYYMAPTFMVIGAHFLLKETMTVKKAFCVVIALIGMVLVSGVVHSEPPTSGELKGILFGLVAALFYACVILLNKKLTISSAMERTVLQLLFAAIILAPYTAFTVNPAEIEVSSLAIILLLVAGIIHTGLPYLWYFGSIEKLPAQTVALFSYIDPIVAIILSALVLNEPMGIAELIGSVLILGTAYISEK